MSNNNPNSSVEETRDGSIIFLNNRKNTVERVKAKRGDSGNAAAETDQDSCTLVAPKSSKPIGKTKAKMLIAAHQIKQRKLSIGSTQAAANLLKQNLQASGDGIVRPGITSGSRAQTEASKVNSPESPRRISSKSAGIKIQNQKGRDNEESKTRKRVDSSKPTKSVKKGSIICLKRRDAHATEGSQHLSSSKQLGGVVKGGKGERVTSVDIDGKQSSKRSQQTDAPSLKIKRMAKSKNTRGGSSRPSTVVRQQDSSQYTSVNETTVAADSHLGHESLLRDLHPNQSNTILGDMSLLSKIGADSKGQMLVMPNLSYGGGHKGKQNILINQSS